MTATEHYFQVVQRYLELVREACKLYREAGATPAPLLGSPEWHERRERLMVEIAAAGKSAEWAWIAGLEDYPRREALRLHAELDQSESALLDAIESCRKSREAERLA